MVEEVIECWKCDYPMVKGSVLHNLETDGRHLNISSECYICPKCHNRVMDTEQMDYLRKKHKEISNGSQEKEAC